MPALQVPSRARATFHENIPSPVHLAEQVRKMGYCGQDGAVRALCLVAYRHLRNTHRLVQRKCRPSEIPPFDRALLLGPTGCGKSHLAEILFQRILKVPYAGVDVTGFTESGYVGDDVSSVLARLFTGAEGNLEMAQHGVLFLDEFDKLASQSSPSRYAGAGTSKDVSGHGVQKELLKILGGQKVRLGSRGLYSDAQIEGVLFDTRHLTILAAGAFSGLRTVSLGPGHIGFGEATRPDSGDAIQAHFQRDEVDDPDSLARYGFMPELMGRFNRMVILEPLNEETLLQILRGNILERHRREFLSEGIELEVSEEAVRTLVGMAVKSRTGARGLEKVISSRLEEVSFQSFGMRDVRKIRLQWLDGDLRAEAA